MAGNTQELTVEQIEERPAAPETSEDYPKVEAGSGLAPEAAPIGSIPLSVSEGDLPHHRAADPATIEEQEGQDTGA